MPAPLRFPPRSTLIFEIMHARVYSRCSRSSHRRQCRTPPSQACTHPLQRQKPTPRAATDDAEATIHKFSIQGRIREDKHTKYCVAPIHDINILYKRQRREKQLCNVGRVLRRLAWVARRPVLDRAAATHRDVQRRGVEQYPSANDSASSQGHRLEDTHTATKRFHPSLKIGAQNSTCDCRGLP
jgi:hypothetical protein